MNIAKGLAARYHKTPLWVFHYPLVSLQERSWNRRTISYPPQNQTLDFEVTRFLWRWKVAIASHMFGIILWRWCLLLFWNLSIELKLWWCLLLFWWCLLLFWNHIWSNHLRIEMIVFYFSFDTQHLRAQGRWRFFWVVITCNRQKRLQVSPIKFASPNYLSYLVCAAASLTVTTRTTTKKNTKTSAHFDPQKLPGLCLASQVLRWTLFCQWAFWIICGVTSKNPQSLWIICGGSS